MRKWKEMTYLLAILSVVFFAFSCSDDDDNDGDNGTPTQNVKELISHKWVVSDGTSHIHSIEFNEDGNYILVGNLNQIRNVEESEEPTYYYGQYTFDDTQYSAVTLKNLGTIDIQKLDDNNFDFILKLSGKSEFYLKTTKAAEMSSTTNTDLLCRTWIYESETEDGEPVSAEDEARNKGMTAIFSRAGTYFVDRPNGDEDEGGLAKWKWDPAANEKAIMYSWDNYENPADDRYKSVEIQVSKELLVITETFEDEGVQVAVTTLKPYNGTLKSAGNKIPADLKNGKGFFRNR